MIAPLLVMGATGRIGRVLRHCWATRPPMGLRPIWQARRPAAGYVAWDILAQPCPVDLTGGVVLCLAGVVPGTAGQMGQNTDLALAACAAAKAGGARHVFLASSAAVYGAAGTALPEESQPQPAAPYGAAKLAMERAVLDWQRAHGLGVTILRIGNIAGLDALLGQARADRVVQLDPVPGQDGGPVRSYIGPRTLALVLGGLAERAARGADLPPVLNVAAAPAVSMGALLDAAGIGWAYAPPNPAVIPKVELETARLQALVPLAAGAGRPENMVAEWREIQG
ncbi:NAD-dependent epimerase/dehydratase family protein [Pseudorhodobacter sp. E13]|uniref:NAD-dependent epimerase/dehydratase family protein n=1 Tax=Pseudorhodobacter sp. E13 TaxID=2487931 RepID=UPI000F8F1B9D|nr:NAD-dependent epimerase/dehydratase family protein [Pseudorhodobacter sp. E13]RUS59613.1 NAD-dependent epimerase/dehydratase family protein [Pseudorhodobacter sp. E13]